MRQLLVRQVDDAVFAALKERAARHGRSVEAEHRAILEETLLPSRADFAETAALLRAATVGRFAVDSAELVRQDRDER